MSTKIIFIDDLTAVNGENFKKQFLSRLNAKNTNIKFFNPLQLTRNYLKIINKNFQLNSTDFYYVYLNIWYSKLLEIKEENEKVMFEKTKDTYYIIDEIPFLYNIFKDNNEITESFLLEFDSLLKYMTFINITSFTEFKIDNIDYNSMYYQNEIYKMYNIETKADRINTVESLKEMIEETFMLFRKKGINCVTNNINYHEDIPKAIKKVFEYLYI